MKHKFDKYFYHSPHIFGLAIVVDHRCKESGLQTLLYITFGSEDQFEPTIETLKKLFEE